MIGAGVSGLAAARLLDRVHEVDLFEQEKRAGGHAHTVDHRGLALDTGFLVHNEQNYPLLCRLFEELGIRTVESAMSFSVSCARCGLEWSGRRPFARVRNAASPSFIALLAEVGRWLSSAGASLELLDEHLSLEQYLDLHRYSQRFRRHFLIPLTAALWSTAPGRALEYPAASALRFFANHGMLGFRRLRWRTVVGGSRNYVEALLASLRGELHLGLGVRTLRRTVDGVELRTDDGALRLYDHAVVATHADQALTLLADPSPEEQRTLARFEYTKNEAVLHTSSSLLPRTRAARASWNYLLGADGEPTITYWLNSLQRLKGDEDYCVTLNAPVPEAAVIGRYRYSHPLFTPDTIEAQRLLRTLSGQRHTSYAGAHLGNGFHEAGLSSGVAAASALGAAW